MRPFPSFSRIPAIMLSANSPGGAAIPQSIGWKYKKIGRPDGRPILFLPISNSRKEDRLQECLSAYHPLLELVLATAEPVQADHLVRFAELVADLTARLIFSKPSNHCTTCHCIHVL